MSGQSGAGTVLPFLPKQRWERVVERNAPVVAPATVFTETIVACSGYNKIVGTVITDQSGILEFRFGFIDGVWDWIERVNCNVQMATTAFNPGAYSFRIPIVSSRLQVVWTMGGLAGLVRYGIYMVPV